jgi:hypothetical protein
MPAVAGAKQYVVATVNSTQGWAYATLSPGADGSSGRVGCQFYGAGANMMCWVGGTNGSDQCYTNTVDSPSFAKNVRAMNSASFVALYWNPATHACTDMRLVQGSQFLPDYHRPGISTDRVSIGSDRARGTLSGVRYNDENPNEFISCDIWASGSIYCAARDNRNISAECSIKESENPLFAEAVRSINAFTSVEFQFDAQTGKCLRLLSYRDTIYLP